MVTVNTELRKLRPAELYNLGMILNPSDNWKKLMASVMKDGSDNVPKFTGEYITIVEHAARQERKLAASMFLEEWATMGRKRPTVGLLLDLLKKIELFRAADYLAQEVLKVAAPERPLSGPAAPIDIDAISDLLLRQNLQSASATNDSDFCLRTTNEVHQSQINYPISAFDSDAASTNCDNLAVDHNVVGVIEMQYAESKSNQALDAAVRGKENDTDLMKFSASKSEHLKGYSGSDLLKFDSENIDSNEKIELCEAVMPNLSLLGLNSSTKVDVRVNESYMLPQCKELRSAELPACLGAFGASGELQACDDNGNNPENLYFHREMMSAELPLCINDRTSVDSAKLPLCINDRTSVDSAELPLCINSRMGFNSEESKLSENSFESSESLDTRSVHSVVKGNAENANIPSLKSQELPITVLEFHER